MKAEDFKYRMWFTDYDGMQMIYSDDASYFIDEDCTDLMLYTGLKDKYNNEIYSDDILHDANTDLKFRVYFTSGGFVIKAPYWAAKNMNDLIPTDDLITESLSNAHVRAWIEQNCGVIGNIYENPELL